MSSVNDERRAAGKVAVRVVRYEQRGTGNDPMQCALVAVVEDGCEELGIPAGSQVEVRMSEYPLDCNRLITELMHGSDGFGVPACGAGSLVRFASCMGTPGEGVVQAAAYEVLEAAPAPALTAARHFGAAEGGPAHRLW